MSLTIPPLIYTPFGVDAGGSFITEPIPVPSQIGVTAGAASFTDGFPPLTMTALSAGGIPPKGQDLNGILFMITANTAWVSAGMGYTFSSAFAADIGGYPVGAQVLMADGSGYWLNTTAANSTNPDTTANSGWVPVSSYGVANVALTGGSVTLTAAQYRRGIIVLTGALGSNATVVFPNIEGEWLVVNATTNAYTVTVSAGGSDTVTIPQAGYAGAYSIFNVDGSNLFTSNFSSAGLAPLASPAFTGTPTAPTATPATANTTQIATTAFAQAAIAAAIAGLAPKASPDLTGVPTAPTAAPGTNSLQLATTAFVQAAAAASVSANKTVFPGGFITQNGLTGVVSGGSTYSVTFPTPFPTACDDVYFTSGSLSVDSSYVPCFLKAKTAAGFTFGTQGGSGSPQVWWRAFGR